MADPISLNPEDYNKSTTPEQPPIELASTSQTPDAQLDAGTLQNRAFKAAYGLSNTPAAKSQDELTTQFLFGNESIVRNDASAILNNAQEKQKWDFINSYTANKQGPITEEEFRQLNALRQFNFNYDPRFVLEAAYANQTISELDNYANKVGDDSAFTQLKQVQQQYQFPQDDLGAIKDWGSVQTAVNQYIVKRLQDNEARLRDQSWGSYLWNEVKYMAPFSPAYEIGMRGNVPGVSMLSGVTLGENLMNQSIQLRQLPFGQVIDTIDNVYNHSSPQFTQMFLSKMLNESKTDYVLDSVNSVGTALDAAALIKIGGKLVRFGSIMNQGRTAYKTMVKAAAEPESTKASVMTSVGDLPDAAVELSAADLNRTLTNTMLPKERAVNSLTRNLRLDKENVLTDSGLAETLRNHIADQYDASAKTWTTVLGNILRVDRIPLQGATRDLLQAIKDATLKRYSSISNNITHISDFVREPFSNTYNLFMWVGKDGGGFFDKWEEAASYARAHGLRVTLNPDQLADIDTKITEVKQTLKDMGAPEMEADVHGLNYRDRLEKQINDLEYFKKEFSQPEGFTIGQHGLGHYIQIWKSLNETDSVVRDLLVRGDRPESVSPSSWTNLIPGFSKIRTAEDTLSAEHNAMRTAALYPQSIIFWMAHQEGKSIAKLGGPMSRILRNKEWKRLKDTLSFNQRAVSPYEEDAGRQGFYFKKISELNDHYMTRFGELPSDRAVEAYFAVKRWAELDRVLREMGLYRFKARLGVETHQVIATDGQGNEIRTPRFDGRQINKFPGGSSNALIIDPSGRSRILDLSKLEQADLAKAQGTKIKDIGKTARVDRDNVTKLLQEGKLRGIQVFNPEERPFKGFVEGGDTNIEYVFAPNIETGPLTWQQVSRTGGGHLVYDYLHYIKQAIIRSERVDGTLKHRYEGDNTIHPVRFRAEGEQYVQKMNAIRELLKEGKTQEAHALFDRSFLPYSWKDFTKKFRRTKDANGVLQPAEWSLHEPFEVVQKNQTIFDKSKALQERYGPGTINKGVFVDNTRQGSLARNFLVQFTGQRDARHLMAIENVGSIENPSFALKPAEIVDPYRIMNRGLTQIIRSTFLDDYKIAAVEAWLREVKDHINIGPNTDGELKSSPFYWFKTINKDHFSKGTDQGFINQMLANKFKIDQLVGVNSSMDNMLHSAAQRMADKFYSAGYKRAAIVPTILLPKLRDPAAFMRSVTFNAYLGFFSVPQLFVQMAGFVPMFAITPRYAAKGTFAALLHGYSRINKNPEIVEHLDSLASKMGWRPGEWKEAMEYSDRTGFLSVNTSMYGPLNTVKDANIIRGPVGKFLNLGQFPFRAGESAVRTGAWYTAFKEFRDAHPTGAISQSDLQSILKRADLLYGNMSSASNSMLHTGVWALPMQFYAYTMRQAELFLGKRLGNTLAERNLARMRLLAFNAAAFGVPLAMGTAGLPLGDYIRAEMLQDSSADAAYNPMKYIRGLTGTTEAYQTGQNVVADTIMNGIAEVMLAWATGNHYNIGERYGMQGMTNVAGLFQDTDFLKLIGGASYTLLMNFAGGSGGFVRAMSSLIHADEDYPLTLNDVVNAASILQSVYKGNKAYLALTTGQWVSRNHQKIADVSPWNALFMAGSGLEPLEETDARLLKVDLKAQMDTWKAAERAFNEKMNEQYMALKNNNQDLAGKLFRDAVAFLVAAKMPEDKIVAAIAKANRNLDQSLITNAYWDRFIKLPPPGSSPDRNAEIYRHIYQKFEGQ